MDMRTVKEISKLTGISTRALRYYDEIGLLIPTQKSEAGYRMYDDKDLEKLQQILFFREFDIPLKEIKAIIENPLLDRNQILQMQRKMLTAKKKRLERLIENIDDILKGEHEMDYTVFGKTEIEEMYNAMEANMTAEQRQLFIDQYGSMAEWKKDFLEKASSEEVQKNFKKVVEWYGSKEAAMEASMHPENQDIQLSYQKRIASVLQKLADSREKNVESLEIRSLIGEYDFVTKQLYQMDDVSKINLEVAKEYQKNPQIQKVQDSIYGEGATSFIGRAMESFYQKQ